MMSASHHPPIRRRIERLLVRGLGHEEHSRVWEHLRGCAECRGYYEELRRLEEAAAGDAPLSTVALERLSQLVVPAAIPVPEQQHGLILWLSGAAAAVMAVALAVAVVSLPTDPADELAPRGVATTLATGALAIFRIDPEARRIERLARNQDRIQVRSGDVVQIAYRNERWRNAFVIGWDADGITQWYHPREVNDDSKGAALTTGVVDEPFGGAWVISAPPGPLRLFAVFSDGTLSAAQVSAAVDNVTAAGDPRTVERLPLEAEQDSLLLEVVE